jgi:hypothetical protein
MPNPVHNDIRATNVSTIVSFALIALMVWLWIGANYGPARFGIGGAF